MIRRTIAAWQRRTRQYDTILANQNAIQAQLQAIQQQQQASVQFGHMLSAQISNLLVHIERGQREHRLLAQRLTLPAKSERQAPPAFDIAQPPRAIFPNSVACRQDMFEQPYFSYWSGAIGHEPRYHRKLWEFVFICQALFERDLLTPGSRGLGFGVGEEPLSALFASKGCQIVATDMSPEEAAEAGWTETQQHAAGKEALRQPWMCPDDLFDRNVEFRPCDMNHVPADLTGFDFCWSACALEHLGSIDLGLDFIERSLDCLKPGGYAVHTTELNVSSNDDTLDTGGTVLFRRSDFERLAARLTAKGHIVAPLDFTEGDRPLDQYIDMPPYRSDPHLKLALAGYATTSFGMIIRRKP